jgi:hypothetical protein
LQRRDGVLVAFARKQSRRLGDEPVQTLSVIKTYQHRQFDTQRMKNALRFPPRSGTADVFCRQKASSHASACRKASSSPALEPLHEHAPAMTGAWWTEGVPLSSPLWGRRHDADAEARF